MNVDFQRQRSRQKKHDANRWDFYNRQGSQGLNKVEKIKKRVLFNDVPEVKIFVKDDEPSRRGLNEEQLMNFYKQNLSENISQFDLNMTSLSDQEKEQFIKIKQKQKEQKMKEEEIENKIRLNQPQIQFYQPLKMKSYNLQKQYKGVDSCQKNKQQQRIEGIIECCYEDIIPDQPSFNIINNCSYSSPPVFINFEKSPIFEHVQPLIIPQQPKKGILKISKQEISNQLIQLIKQITKNSKKYSKSQIQFLLKPYKQKGQLNKLVSNQQLYKSIVRHVSPSPSTQSISIDNSSQLSNHKLIRHNDNNNINNNIHYPTNYVSNMNFNPYYYKSYLFPQPNYNLVPKYYLPNYSSNNNQHYHGYRCYK